MSAMWTTCPVCGKGIAVMWPDLYMYRRGKDFMCSENCLIVYETQRTRAANGFTEKRKEGERKDVALTQKQREKAVEIAVQGGDQIAYLKKECGAPNPWATWAYLKKKLEKENPVKYNRLMQVETLKHAGIDPKSKLPENFQDIREVAADTVDRVPPVEPVQCIAHVTAAEIQEAIEKQEPLAPMPLILQGGVDYQLKVDEAKAAEVIKVDRVPTVEIPKQPIQPMGLKGGVNYQLKAEESRKPRKPFKVIGLETEFGTFMAGTVNGVIHFKSEGNAEISMVTEDWVKMADLLPEILRELGVEV